MLLDAGTRVCWQSLLADPGPRWNRGIDATNQAGNPGHCTSDSAALNVLKGESVAVEIGSRLGDQPAQLVWRPVAQAALANLASRGVVFLEGKPGSQAHESPVSEPERGSTDPQGAQ